MNEYHLIFFQAIDIWMGACTTFIFGALLEFTLTNYLWRKGAKGMSKQAQNAQSDSPAATLAVGGSTIPTQQVNFSLYVLDPLFGNVKINDIK